MAFEKKMFNTIIHDISLYLSEYIDVALKTACTVALLKFLACWVIQAKNVTQQSDQKSIYRSFITLPIDFSAVFYAFMVIVITFFSRMEGSTNAVNLRLFSTFGTDLQSKIFIVENIIMFVPFGAFLRLYGVKRFPVSLAVVSVASMAIEVLQFLTGRGIMQIDDILTNTIGGCIGFIATNLLFMVKYRIVMKCRSRK